MKLDSWNLPGVIQITNKGIPKLVSFSIFKDSGAFFGNCLVKEDEDIKSSDIKCGEVSKADIELMVDWLSIHKSQILSSAEGAAIIVKRKF